MNETVGTADLQHHFEVTMFHFLLLLAIDEVYSTLQDSAYRYLSLLHRLCTRVLALLPSKLVVVCAEVLLNFHSNNHNSFLVL